MDYPFTRALFWDTDVEKLDAPKHAAYIIERVLNYGTLQDWKLLKEVYKEEEIVKVTLELKDLHPKTLSFLAHS